MTAANEQIVTAFEIERMSPEEIAQDFEMDVIAVKAVLLQNSMEYRKLSKKNPELCFSDEEANEMRVIMLNLARYTEDPHLQFRAARYIYDDVKGRNDLNTGIKHVNVNVVTFNEQMKRALEAEQRTLNLPDAKVIPV